MSQRELARAVGVSRTTIQNTEGCATTPSADIVARIAEATGWPISAFFTSKTEGRDASTAKQDVAANRTEDTMTRHHAKFTELRGDQPVRRHRDHSMTPSEAARLVGAFGDAVRAEERARASLRGDGSREITTHQAREALLRALTGGAS